MFPISDLNSLVGRLLVFLSIISVAACSEIPFFKSVSNGVIEYEISYPSIPEDNYMLDLMPKKMETRFAENSYRSDIVAGMGLFKTSLISEYGKKDLIHSVKMLNKKYASKLNAAQLESFNPKFQNISIEKTKETKEIAGYNCKSALATIEGDSTFSFKIFYTTDIKIKDANQYTPFKEIDGVLMEYDILSYDVHMRFKAVNLTPNEISKEDILLEEGYKIIDPKDLKKEIEAIFAKVK